MLQDAPVPRQTIHQVVASEYEIMDNVFGKENDVLIGRT